VAGTRAIPERQGRHQATKNSLELSHPIEQLRVASNDLAKDFLVGIDEAELCRRTFLNLDELKLASSMGMEIGSHTMNHVLLENQSPINCHREVKESVETLAVMLDQEVTSLGLPYGGDVVGTPTWWLPQKVTTFCCAITASGIYQRAHLRTRIALY
jgi:hypothetical protein